MFRVVHEEVSYMSEEVRKDIFSHVHRSPLLFFNELVCFWDTYSILNVPIMSMPRLYLLKHK